MKTCPLCGHAAVHFNMGHACSKDGCECKGRAPEDQPRPTPPHRTSQTVQAEADYDWDAISDRLGKETERIVRVEAQGEAPQADTEETIIALTESHANWAKRCGRVEAKLVKLWDAAQEFYASDSAWKQSTRDKLRGTLGQILKETEPSDEMLTRVETGAHPSQDAPPCKLCAGDDDPQWGKVGPAAWIHIRGEYSWRHPLEKDRMMSVPCANPGFSQWCSVASPNRSLADAFSAGIAWQAGARSTPSLGTYDLEVDAILRVAVGELDRGTPEQRLEYIAATCRIILRRDPLPGIQSGSTPSPDLQDKAEKLANVLAGAANVSSYDIRVNYERFESFKECAKKALLDMAASSSGPQGIDDGTASRCIHGVWLADHCYQCAGAKAPSPDPPQNDKALEGLRYIADSPAHEHGGFHPEAVKTAKNAISEIERLREALREIESTSRLMDGKCKWHHSRTFIGLAEIADKALAPSLPTKGEK